MTVSKRMLANKKIKELMILADEEAQNPFDSWTKLQLLLNRSKSADGLVWVCFAMHLSHQLVKQWIFSWNQFSSRRFVNSLDFFTEV